MTKEQDVMPVEDRTDEQGRRSTDTWHVIRGIPIAVLLALGMQTVAVVWYIAGLDNRVATQGAELTRAVTEWKTEVGKLSAKLDALASIVQSGSVPTALNERRIGDVERQLALIQSKVYDDDHRISALEVRQRAAREK